MSQYALAQQAGLSKQAISKLEKGEREPTWTTVQRLAMVLGQDYQAFADPGIKLLLPDVKARGRGRPPKQAEGRARTTKGSGERAFRSSIRLTVVPARKAVRTTTRPAAGG
jgi:DNA-binding XRE family transcriptional regulator